MIKSQLRRSEWVLAAYFIYAAILAQFLPLRPPLPALTVAVNAVVIGGFLLADWAESLRRSRFFSILRDWYPTPLMLLAYREMGWFAPATHDQRLERAWESWDKVLLNEWGLHRALESLGPLLPAVLEISYALVFAVPFFALGMFYVYDRRARVDAFLCNFLLGILIAYTLYPLFPSEPPRAVFPGEDFPAYNSIFRRFNWALLGGYGIHTSVFPSAHVSGAFSAAFATLRLLKEHRWVGWFLLGLAVSIALATVYGRYHYGADALAGFALSVAARWISIRWDRRRRSG